MSTTIQLLGRPRITRGAGDVYRFRSRKSWALLAYLILSERPAGRGQLASLLFPGADDPARALRWGLAEIRRALGDEGAVDGDPVALRLPPDAVVDVQVALGGLDEEGLASLHEADEIALAHGLRDAAAQARAELGYVDFLRGRYDRAEHWLTDALEYASGSPSMQAKAMTYLGAVESDRASYRRATTLLEQAVTLSRAVREPRRQAYALSMLGRISLFRGALDVAAGQLDASIKLAEHDHWLAFLPWPQALRGEVQLARADPAGAAELLQHAFARACQLGDPCWEGTAARGLALVAEAEGDTEGAFSLLADARARCRRLADPYLWLDGYILDAQCELGRRHGHPDTRDWIETLRNLASRSGMRELTLRSLRHGAALGREGDGAAAAVLADEIAVYR